MVDNDIVPVVVAIQECGDEALYISGFLMPHSAGNTVYSIDIVAALETGTLAKRLVTIDHITVADVDRWPYLLKDLTILGRTLDLAQKEI